MRSRKEQDGGCFLPSSPPLSLSPALQHTDGIGDPNARSSVSSQPCCCPLCPHLILGQGSTCTQPMAQLHPPTWRQHSKCKCRVIRGAQHHTAPHGVRVTGLPAPPGKGAEGEEGLQGDFGGGGHCTGLGWVIAHWVALPCTASCRVVPCCIGLGWVAVRCVAVRCARLCCTQHTACVQS